MKRISLTVEPEIDKRLSQLKKTEYYDKSFSEMYRQLIVAGIEKHEKEGNE